MLGARWVYLLEADGQEPWQSVCEVTETFTWPDGTPGSTLSCTSNGGATTRDTRYALYSDRVERREVIGRTKEGPVQSWSSFTCRDYVALTHGLALTNLNA